MKENRFFEKAKSKANEALKNKDKLSSLLGATMDKVGDLESRKLDFSKLKSRVKVLVRMVRSYFKGEYRDISKTSLLLIATALIYFVMPIDLIADFIPLGGLVDDLAVVVWVYNQIGQEVDKYIDWETKTKVN